MNKHLRKIRITQPAVTKPRNMPTAKTPAETEPRRLLIIEDQASIRELLEESLGNLSSCRVVGSAADGLKGLEMILSLRPDIIVLDVVMPGISGIELLRRLGDNHPELKVLVFSAKQEPQIVRSLVQEGIHGYVNKNSKLQDLRRAIETIMAGGTWFSEDFSRSVREALATPSRHPDGMMDMLTPREREIAVLIARSHSSKEVARLLDISIKTAENHRANLMRKLGVRDVAGLVRLIIRLGLVDPTEG